MANINFQKETKFSRLLNKHEIRRHDFLANGGFKQWPNSGFAWTWTLFRRPFAFDFSPVLLAIQTRINDNRRYSVRYKVSRVCHAIVSLIVYNGRKNRPLLFPLFFSTFSVLSFLSNIVSRNNEGYVQVIGDDSVRFTRMFFITHRVYRTMLPRQLNTCSRTSAWQYPRKRERACTNVRAHLTMKPRHTPKARAVRRHAFLIT